MEFNVLKRDRATVKWRHDSLLSPENQQDHLKLLRYQVTEEELRNVRNHLAQTHCFVHRLSLSGVSFNDKKAKLLAKGIQANDSITELTFNKCKINVKHMKRLAKAISVSHSIQYIRFYSCNMLKQQAALLGQALAQNMTLKHLVLIQAGLGDLALTEIAKGIKEAYCLEFIDLRHNHFESKGFEALTDALKTTMACKVLQIEGFHMMAAEGQLISSFLMHPDCMIKEFDLHQAELEYEVLENICEALSTCRYLKDLSFCKNNMGIDHDNESSSESDESFLEDKRLDNNRNRRQNLAEDICMTQLVADLARSKPDMDRLCMAHCNINDRGMHILGVQLQKTKLRYVNISWCRLTAESVPFLCTFIKENKYLEKLLMQHNEIYAPMEGQEGGNSAMKKVILAVKYHPSLKYLDISATHLGSSNLNLLFELQAKKEIKLENLQSRKNLIIGSELHNAFSRLRLGKTLKVINLQDNLIHDQCAHEILEQYASVNIYLESVILKGNKCLNSSDVERINDECRKNLLIQMHILPRLPIAEETGYELPSGVPETCCNKEFDVRKLSFEDVSFYTADFIQKFIAIHDREVISLHLNNVNTELQLFSLFNCLENSHSITTLHIENCTVREEYLRDFLKGLKTNTTLKSLSLVNMMNIQKYLRLMFRSLKSNTTLEHLRLEENEIDNYKYINKLIRNNHFIHKLDIRGNYMNEEILEELWDSLKNNIELVNLHFDSQDNELDPLAIQSVDTQLDINRYIQDTIVVHVRQRMGNLASRAKHFESLPEQDLSGLHCDKPCALMKYLSMCTGSKKVNLSNSDINEGVLIELADQLHHRLILFEEIDLSNLAAINDDLLERLSTLFFTHNEESGISSSISTIILDNNKITNVGLVMMLDSTAQNTLLRKISLKNCKIAFDDNNIYDSNAPIQSLERNCGIVELDLDGNPVIDFVLDKMRDELEKNQGIVETIFPVIKERELMFLRKRVELIRLQTLHGQGIGSTKFSSFARQHGKNRHMQGSTKFGNGSGSAKGSMHMLSKSGYGQRSGAKTLKFSRPINRATAAIATLEDATSSKKGSFQLSRAGSACLADDSIMSSDTENDTEKLKLSEFQDPEENKVTKTTLSLHNKKLKRLDFLTKFVREFPRIQHIDLGNNAISNNEMEKFMSALERNEHIEKIDVGGNKIGGNMKKKMQRELEKNKQINGLIKSNLIDETPMRGKHTINAKNRGIKDIGFIQKMMLNEDFARIQELDMSGNKLDDDGARQIAGLLSDATTIRSVCISNNKLTQVGLQDICSALAKPDCQVISLDISNNRIPDRQLKMLMGMLYMNEKILSIKYTLDEEKNRDRRNKFHELQHEFEQHEDPTIDEAKDHFCSVMADVHHPKIKCWHYIVFPVWIWKTFIHAKHEAFRFKYDSESLKIVERDQMPYVGFVMYLLTFFYFGMMFGFPAIFINGECGEGLSPWVFYLYIVQAVTTAFCELLIVKLIEKKVKKKSILKFNRWHFVELIMGQIARLDTFLDACFLVMLIQCEMWNLVIPVSTFIVLMLSYPMTQIFRLCRVNKDLIHSLPFMERNCFLAFIRENMLLATVLDSFCISNTVTLFKKPIAFGKLMGAYTFFFQDFPQLSIHVYFLVFMHDPASLILHEHWLVLVSLIVSCFAIAISLFNFVMFKQNDFDPLVIEQELFIRRLSAQRADKSKERFIETKTSFKRKIKQPVPKSSEQVRAMRRQSSINLVKRQSLKIDRSDIEDQAARSIQSSSSNSEKPEVKVQKKSKFEKKNVLPTIQPLLETDEDEMHTARGLIIQKPSLKNTADKKEAIVEEDENYFDFDKDIDARA